MCFPQSWIFYASIGANFHVALFTLILRPRMSLACDVIPSCLVMTDELTGRDDGERAYILASSFRFSI
jgi:hypothetical protein